MDTTGFSQVGRYGTLSLLKRPTPRVTTTTTTTTTKATTGPSSSTLEAEAEAKAEAETMMSPSQTKVITSFGIDSPNLTFGSVTTCDVRLYYPEVDHVHCRLIHEDGKAFLVVQGKAGALVDGSWVYPHTSSTSTSTSTFSNDDSSQQTITPLTNNSEFEIHNKRFRFTYPPKEVRKVLLATPVAHRNRTLRLSMIQSAQVFSPRPSKDPRENLKILQSPLKTSVFASAAAAANGNGMRDRSMSPTKPRAVSPLKFGIRPDDDDDEEDSESDDDEDVEINANANQINDNDNDGEDAEEHIILAHTNHPRVVEEDQDLVILEDIPLHLVLPSPSVYSSSSARGTPVPVRQRQRAMDPPGTPTPTPVLAQPQPQMQQQQQQQQQPRTPRRRSIGGNALHRAVLIRSAQRAVWRAEREKEEEEEEMEVLGAVVAPGDADEREDEGMEDDDDDDEQEQEDVEMRSVSSGSDDDEASDEQDEHDEDKVETKPLWKKGLARIIPWPFGGKKDDKEEEDAEDTNVERHEEDEELHEEEAEEKLSSLPVLPQQHTPIRRALGSFMTPQAIQPAQTRKNIFPSTASEHSESTTTTTSHAGPGRYSLGGGEARRVVVQQPWRVKDLVVPPIGAPAPALAPSSEPVLVPRAMDPPPSTPPTVVRPPRLSVSEEERKAIQERRRSAVREVREDSFWKDGAPGMSPAKKPFSGLGLGLGRPTTSPRKPLLSPTKGRSLGYAITEAVGEGEEREADADMPENNGAIGTEEPESTVDLLERMRETVEDMKRRRSVATLSTPRTTLLEGDSTGMRGSAIRGSVKKLDFSHVTPAKPKKRLLEDEPNSKPAPADQSDLASGAKEVNNEEEEMVEPRESEPFSLLRPGARPSLSPKKMESTFTLPRVPAVIVDTVAEDAEEPDNDGDDDGAKIKRRTRGRSRLLRAPHKEIHDEAPVNHHDVGKPEEEEEEEEGSSHSKSKSATKPPSRSKPPSTTKPRSRTARSPVPPVVPGDSLAPEPSGSGPRRQRSRTPQPRQEVEEAEAEPAVEHAPTRSLPRRTRKGTAEPEEAPTVPKKRGKKAIPEPEPEEEVEEEAVEKVKPTPAKRGRKPRAAPTPSPVEEEKEEQEEPHVPAPTKRGRSKKVKEVAPAANGDEDELDSYEVTQPAANVKKVSKIPARIPTLARGLKRAAEVATPEPPIEEEEESVPLAATRAGRAPRGNANATAKTKTPPNVPTTATGRATAGGAATKPRGRVKTPASAPAAVATSATSGDIAEKENTPGAGSGSANGSDEEPAVTKVRVSRKGSATTGATAAAGSGKTARTTTTKTKAKSAVKVEQNDDAEQEVVAGGRTRTTRIMRTRTKTG